MLEPNDIILISGETYIVTKKLPNTHPLTYEITHTENDEDSFLVGDRQVSENIGNNWRKVEL